jgi:hypothetical protein
MSDDFLHAAGPIWGPDFIIVTAQDDTGVSYALEVYPDAKNQQLKAAGLAEQYYFQPGHVYVAKLQNGVDYDFGMTLFKGLMTSETDIGVSAMNTSNGTVEVGGGFCTFATTFAVPDSVLANAVQKLKSKDHPAPADRISQLFGFQDGDTDPLLGIIPITENDVQVFVPDLVDASGTKNPMFINAQGNGKGSIEAHGNSSFVVTCNQLAAGAIAGSLQKGIPPFVIQCALKEQFYIETCQITLDIQYDKVYDSISGAVNAGGFLGIGSFALSAAYANCLTNGGIIIDIKMDSGILTDDQKKWIQQNVDDLQKKAWDLVKSNIFDWDPSKGDTPASADRGIMSSLFGGSSVSLKANYQHRGLHVGDTIRLSETTTVVNSISGDLNDLTTEVAAHLDKYLAIVDIGRWFQKVQVAAMSAVNFDETLPDGTSLRDPVVSVQLEAAYPDFSQPAGTAGNPNLQTLGQGFHYTLGQSNPQNTSVSPVIWTKDNPKDVINVSWLRLNNDLPNWKADEVRLVRTVIYDRNDPRVDLSNGQVSYTRQDDTAEHAPIINPAEVGYVFVHFVLDRVLPKENVTVTLTCVLGPRTDSLTFTKDNQKSVIWEIFSDKFTDATQFTYEVQVEVAPPDSMFGAPAITWQSAAPVTVDIPAGRIKYINPYKIVLPAAPADQLATINSYITGASA